MHATRHPDAGTRPRFARVWFPLLLAGAAMLAALAVPASSTEVNLAPIVQAPRDPVARTVKRPEPRPLLVEAQPIPLSTLESSPVRRPTVEPRQARPPVTSSVSAQKDGSLSSFIEITPPETQAKPAVTTDEPGAQEPGKQSPVLVPAHDAAAQRELRRQAFLATRGGRLARQASQPGKQASSPQLASSLTAALASMQNAGGRTHKGQVVIQARPFDPTRSTTSAAPSGSGLAKVSERKLPPVFDLKRAQPRQQKSLIVMAPQDPAQADDTQAEETQPTVEGDRDAAVVAAPTQLVSSSQSPLSELVSVPPTKSVVQLVEPTSLDSRKDVTTPQPNDATTRSPLATAHDPVVRFAAEDILAATLQPEEIPSAETLRDSNTSTSNSPSDVAVVPAEDAIDDGLKPINSVLTGIAPKAGDLPQDYASVRFSREGAVAHRMGTSRESAESMVMWEAPASCHRPLYFEDVNMERHGYKVPLVQPMLSAAHFFGRAPLLPYMMLTQRSRECGYTLGHYRPGDYAPYSLYVRRPRLDATGVEGAAVLGLILAFP